MKCIFYFITMNAHEVGVSMMMATPEAVANAKALVCGWAITHFTELYAHIPQSAVDAFWDEHGKLITAVLSKAGTQFFKVLEEDECAYENIRVRALEFARTCSTSLATVKSVANDRKKTSAALDDLGELFLSL